MAHDVTLMGATYPDVPSIVVPSGNGMASFTDVTDTTATASDVASGKQFYTAAGVLTQGTSSGGGGGSAWTKVAEKSYTTNYTGTSANTLATWATGHSEIWTSGKWVYVRVRDTAGKRDGYFYGSDSFFYNISVANGTSAESSTSSVRIAIRYSSGAFGQCPLTATNGYGVWADMIYPDGDIRIRRRYSTTYSLTINGTYKVEVYLLDPAGGVPIFG